MPQTFQVLRCYKCEVFQVHPTKKSTKWQCKLCGEKQSIKRFYGLGTGKECRLHVQKLNGIRGEIDGNNSTLSDVSDTTENPDHPEQDMVPVCSTGKNSKWLHYVDFQEVENQEIPNEPMHLNDTEIVLELPLKRRKKYQNVRNKTFRTPNKIEENESFGTQNNNQNHESLEELMRLHHYEKDNVLSSLESNELDLDPCLSKPAIRQSPKKYVPPAVPNNSKWAEFVDETQNDNNENESEPFANRSVGPVFPFLEEENIDSILDL